MRSSQHETVLIRTESDLPLVRLMVRTRATELGFNATALTMLVTAASELGRNTLIHGGGGAAVAETVDDGGRTGMRIAFSDQGPGIADIALAMTDGYTTKGGMGKGLSGSKRLVDVFAIESEVGRGTVVTVIRWA
jgi:serine/threonine-protein kinase RsbT